MRKIILWLFFFVSFALIFRTAVMHKTQPPAFSDYTNVLETVDESFADLQSDMEKWINTYRDSNRSWIEDKKFPGWLKSLFYFLTDMVVSIRLTFVYTFGLIRYITYAFVIIFGFLFV